MFIDDLKDEALQGETNYSLTENGALAYKDSGKNLVNLNYAVSNMRKMHSDDILKLFRKAFSFSHFAQPDCILAFFTPISATLSYAFSGSKTSLSSFSKPIPTNLFEEKYFLGG